MSNKFHYVSYQSVNFAHDGDGVGAEIATRINSAVDKMGKPESERENGGQTARGRAGLAAK